MPSKSKAKKSKQQAPNAEVVEVRADPREPFEQTPANFKATLAAIEAVLTTLPTPAEPLPMDFVDAVVHITLADGVECGYGQEARRRIAEAFVDRNEFRVTEAYEVEELLADLPIPGLFDRCLALRETISQIYADQNAVKLDFLRDASIGDRNMFFQRVPAMPDHVVGFLQQVLTFEELCFSDKSTVRAMQRINLDPKNTAANEFFDNVRALLKPFGHTPLCVGPDLPGGKPNLTQPLSPACLLVRMAPESKVKKRR